MLLSLLSTTRLGEKVHKVAMQSSPSMQYPRYNIVLRWQNKVRFMGRLKDWVPHLDDDRVLVCANRVLGIRAGRLLFTSTDH